MKTRITTIVALLALAFTLSAQKGNVNSADYELTLPKPDFEKAEAKILEAEKHKKTANYPKTYIVKSRLYKTKYQKAKKKDTDDLFTAMEAIQKAEELDIKGDEKGKKIGKFRDEIKKDLMLLRIELQNGGAEAYNANNFEVATSCFEKMLMIDQMPYSIGEGETAPMDTAILFNAAISAYKGKDASKTEELMLKCIDYNYGESTPHTVLFIQYREAEDTVKMVEMLKDGFQKYPEDPTFLRELVVYYIGINDLEEGMKYINIALDGDPENSSFWFTKGTFHDQAGETEKAIKAYDKALETAVSDDEIYNANYNLAVIYFNQAVEAANAANDILDDMALSSKKQAEAKEMFKDCVPYFEACLEIKPDNLETLKALRPVYYRLSDDPAINTKYEALLAKIKELE